MNKNSHSARTLGWDFQCAQFALILIWGSRHSRASAQTWLSLLAPLEAEDRCVVTSPLSSPYSQRLFHETHNSTGAINSYKTSRHFSGRKTQVLSGLSGWISLILWWSSPAEIWPRSDESLTSRKSDLSKCHIGVVEWRPPRERPF